MDTNDLPEDEPERLRIIKSLQLLDTPAEKAFDLIAEAARSAAQSNGGFLSLVGRDSVWFKAAAGVEALSLPRSEALCDHWSEPARGW